MRSEMMRLAMLAAAVIVAAGCRDANGARDVYAVRFGEPKALSASTTVGTAPMFAVDSDGTEAVAWVSAPAGGTDGRLYVAVGNGAPVELRDTLGPIEAHGESPPKLAYGARGTLYAVYVVGKEVPGRRFPLAALRLVKSADGGKHWSAPVTVTDGSVFGAHNFQALHVARDGTIYVSWLGAPEAGSAGGDEQMHMDGMAGMDHGAMQHGAMKHGASAAWITRSTDGGRTWMPRVRVDLGEACPCCRTALASARDGTLYMAWRHVYPGSVRDVVVARSTDKGATWSAPVRVHADDWKFDACPHAGPALAVDSAGTVHVAWWTGREGSAGVRYARSTDGAKSFLAPVDLGVAKYSRPAHVQLALGRGGRVLAAWDDGTTKEPRVLVRVSRDGGARFAPATVVSEAGHAGTFPVLGVSGDSLAVAWTEEGKAPSDEMKESGGLHPVGDARVLVRRGALQ